MNLFANPASTLPPLLAGLAVCLVSGPARADIEGTVHLDGAEPRPAPVDVSADPACRAAGAKSRALIVEGGLVANTFLYLAGVPAAKEPPHGRVRIKTDKCRFSPRITGVRVGQKLVVENGDGTLYSIRVSGGGARLAQRLPKKGSRIVTRFKEPHVMARVSCDVHGWAVAHLGVLDHPHFAVSDDKGAFKLPTEGLPDGEYALHAWHEVLGSRVAKVKITKGVARVSIRFGEAKSSNP